MLKKSINDEMQYESKFDSQLTKYEIMKNKTHCALIVRKNLLNKTISFENMAILKNETEVYEKQKLYHELEDHVKLIKSETMEMDYKLGLIQDEIRKREKTILEYQGKARYLLPERNNYIKDFLIHTIKLMKIYRSLNVFSIKEIIEIFNKEKFNYESNYMQFNNLNKEIVDLNIILTAYERDLHKLELSIKSKEFRDMMSGNYKSDMEVNNLEIILKESKSSVEEQVDKIAQIGKIFVKVKRDFLAYEKTLTFVVRCINDFSLLKLKDKESCKNSNSNSNSKYIKETNGSMSQIMEKNKIESSNSLKNFEKNINMLPNNSEWSEKQSKKILFKF